MKKLIFLIFVLLFVSNSEAQRRVIELDSAPLSAAAISDAVEVLGSSAEIYLDITLLTLADADDEVDFFLQTTDGIIWTDLQNFHFKNSDDGSTVIKIATINDNLDGPGTIQSITGTDPSAGNEISQTVPANTIWRLWGMYATLVTDAGVADRRASRYIDD